MSQQIPAFKGKFGSTEFYIVTMLSGQLYKSLTIPKNLEGWEELSVEERFQREVNYTRVKKHIAPYLADDDDRFIGAFIVAIYQDDEIEFQSLVDAGIKFPKAMPASLMKQFGVLHLAGKEILVPLDGQHRLAAIQFAIEGKDNTGKEIPLFTANPEIAKDTCTVILVPHDTEKSRKIFNKVNRYAKPTSKADNLITADDDYIAVITREIIVGELIDTRVVNIRSNTLSEKDGRFTTLATLYEISSSYEETIIGKKPDVSKLPPSEDIRLAKRNLKEFWEKFLEIEPYKASLIDSEETGDKKRAEIRKQSIACKPIVQRALADTIMLLISDEMSDGKKISINEVVKRINKVSWDPSESIWQGILMNGNKIITGDASRKLAARILAYLLGQKLDSNELKALERQFESSTDNKTLPEPYFSLF